MPRCPNPRCQMDYPPGTTQCTNPFCLCLLPEAVVAGRYRIETLIGIGGMGVVYRVSDTFEMEQVALKVLSLANNAMDEAIAVERFRREARYAHQLKHKNIVPVLNFGQDGKLLYLAMPLVTGGTLKELLKSERPLPVPQVQAYLHDLADAIDAIHNHPQQIVHRDIKPSNLLIHQNDGRLVVTDFGISRAVQQEQSITQRGLTLGTEHYIAPEQEHGKSEPASDIYSMGIVAYQMFTGLLPFQAVVRSRAAELPAPSSLNLALPPAVDQVIFRAMETDPGKRYPTARAFVDALNAALEQKEDNFWSAPTIAASIVATNSANIIVRAIIPENPCGLCGRENRSTSHFCRHCGRTLDVTSPLVNDVCQVGYVSDTGKQAKENEDMLLVLQGLCINLPPPPRPFSLIAVADGLRGPQGKGAGGHEASRLAVETIADVLLPLLTTSSQNVEGTPGKPHLSTGMRPIKQPIEKVLVEWMRDAVRQANQVVYHCNADYETTMASTLTAALLYKRRLYVADVGDSRAYLYNAQKGLHLITNDILVPLPSIPMHSNKELQQDKTSANSYLGPEYHVTIDLFQQDVEIDDLVLLCTNGLWHQLRDERIQEILALGGDPQKLAHILIEEANEAGNTGNMSAIIACVQ